MVGVIEFSKIDSVLPVVDYLTDTISRALVQGKRVLWLVPGGSSIEIAAIVSKKLAGFPLAGLAVTLTDERYGAVGHADSNWLQLEQAGFSLPGAELIPVLNGLTLEKTVENFANELEKILPAVNFRIGLFGIGPDGHTAGILPESSAVSETRLAHGYEAAPYQRITMTGAVIAQLDEAVVYAVGEAKWPTLTDLELEIPAKQQPAQLLKQVPKLLIFNDYKGGK